MIAPFCVAVQDEDDDDDADADFVKGAALPPASTVTIIKGYSRRYMIHTLLVCCCAAASKSTTQKSTISYTSQQFLAACSKRFKLSMKMLNPAACYHAWQQLQIGILNLSHKK